MNARAKSLIGYIFPALGGLFVTYLYNVVDGIFVGQGVGSAALGAVNIAVPFITTVVAVTAMFPMGGAAIVAIRMGRGDKDGTNRAFMTAFSLTLAASVLLMAVGMAFSRQITDISGAEPDLHRIFLLDQAHRHGQRHCRQPRHSAQSADDLLSTARLWGGGYMACAARDRGRDACCYRANREGKG